MARTVAPARAAIGVLGTAALVVATLSAEQVYRSGAEVVLLNVSASEAGRAMLGLARDDFQVLEDGQPQDISIFADGRVPVSLSILLDTSSSMDPKMRLAQEAAIAFCRRLGTLDTAQILTFASDIQVRQPFTNDVALLERAIRQTRANGNTALYTALYVAIDQLQRERPTNPEAVRRQAIVLLSDGQNSSGALDFDAVLERAKRSDVIVFAIGIRDAREKLQDREIGFNEYDFALRSMAQTTGGRVFFVQDPKELPSVYSQVADELANQYTIGYTSRNSSRDGAWRQVSVLIRRPGAVARTRIGYFAPTPRGS